MIEFKVARNVAMRMTDYRPVCSSCGWNNGGKPSRSISFAVEHSSTANQIAMYVDDGLRHVRDFHVCQESGS
jgi:hypothetical protein